MIDFLKSNAGLFTTMTVGLVFQLAGVVLVVRDLMKRHGIARQFMNNMNVIEADHQEMQDDPNVVLKASNGDESFADVFGPAILTDLRARKVELAMRDVITYLLAEVQLPNRWKTWIGPTMLLLGIVLAYAASMFSVR